MFCKGGVGAVRGSPRTLVFDLLFFSITLFFSFLLTITLDGGRVGFTFRF